MDHTDDAVRQSDALVLFGITGVSFARRSFRRSTRWSNATPAAA